MIVSNKNADTEKAFLLYLKFINLWSSAQYFNRISEIKRMVRLQF